MRTFPMNNSKTMNGYAATANATKRPLELALNA